MPIRSVGATPGTRVRDGGREEMSLYAPLVDYRVMAMALDSFFENVVEANVPLESHLVSGWWHRKIVHERVNRFSERWCLIYECIANLRERLVDQMPLDNVDIAPDLTVTWSANGREPETLTWVAIEKERF